MWSLIFSLTSPWLFLALQEEKSKASWKVEKMSFRQHSENFFPSLREILARANCSLAQIEQVFFTSLPGSQTGYRISLAFVFTLQVLNPKIKFYHLNSLLFQAGKAKAISLINFDQKKTKCYGAVFQATKCLVKPKLMGSLEVQKKLIQNKRFSHYLICQDFYQISQNGKKRKVNFLAKFHQLIAHFGPFT